MFYTQLNNSLEPANTWKLLADLGLDSTGTKTVGVDLPTNFNELMIKVTSYNYGWVLTTNIAKDMLLNESQTYHFGYADGTYLMAASTVINKTRIDSCGFVGSNSEKIRSASVYYR